MFLANYQGLNEIELLMVVNLKHKTKRTQLGKTFPSKAKYVDFSSVENAID